MATVTRDLYQLLDEAYTFFNQELFGNTLPAVAITLQRYAQAYGYFHAKQFRSRSGALSGVIALNPDAFLTRDMQAILSTLVHEMVHVWQHEYGKPSRNGYHNRQFAMKMKAVGLIVSRTSAPGGKPTGQAISHYIEPGGLFDHKCATFMQAGLGIVWGTEAVSTTIRPLSKAKFTCPICEQKAWAKPSAHLICGDCHETMEREELLPDS